MATLRETKDHISSVRGTLKITSAMKLVASAKLRKAQRSIENLRPYERELSRILGSLLPSGTVSSETNESPRTAIVVMASNSSMCGAFNANLARKALEVASSCQGEVEIHSVGRKVADSMRRAGYPSPQDYFDLSAHPSYDGAAALAESLVGRFKAGELGSVVLVYSKFVSASRQEIKAETYLPFVPELDPASETVDVSSYIVEPGAAEVVRQMLPQVILLKFYAALLDSAASEHAARMLAMQTATDNGENLLSELVREYNKARQQKITAEILDLVGGATQ